MLFKVSPASRFQMFKMEPSCSVRFSSQAKSVVPLADRALVQRLQVAKQTKSGVLIPETSVKKANEGTVLAVGPGYFCPELFEVCYVYFPCFRLPSSLLTF